MRTLQHFDGVDMAGCILPQPCLNRAPAGDMHQIGVALSPSPGGNEFSLRSDNHGSAVLTGQIDEWCAMLSFSIPASVVPLTLAASL